MAKKNKKKEEENKKNKKDIKKDIKKTNRKNSNLSNKSNNSKNNNKKNKNDKNNNKKDNKNNKIEKIKEEKKNKKQTKKIENNENLNEEPENKNILNEEEEKNSYELFLKKYNELKTNIKNNFIPQLNKNQIKNAIIELKKYMTKNKQNFIDNDYLYLSFLFNKLPIKFSIRPVSIHIKNPIYSNKKICLFIKDKETFEDLNINFQENNINLEYIDTNTLRLKYDRFEDRRKLLKNFDIFLCDIRIYFVLKKKLGKPFYQSKKYPLPIILDYENKEKIINEIKDKINNAIFYMNHGPIYNIKFSTYKTDEKKIEENLYDAISETLPHILKYDVDIDELKAITLKGNDTIELPLYNHLKEEDLKIFCENEK